MTTVFISDLHLAADRPDIGRQFLDFLRGEAADAEALYVLGDLFESWVGDDDPNEHYAGIKTAIRTLVDRGVPVFFMHGNRDFMIGDTFAAETGVEILNDPCRIDIHGYTVLLSHGDALCIDDVEYQQIRIMTRNPDWQAMMLSKPLDERLAIADQARAHSQLKYAGLSEEITDVNLNAVEAMIAEHDVDILLHGHTHRPAVHDVDLDGRRAQRIVLGDWYEHGSVLRWNESGFELATMPR